MHKESILNFHTDREREKKGARELKVRGGRVFFTTCACVLKLANFYSFQEVETIGALGSPETPMVESKLFTGKQ